MPKISTIIPTYNRSHCIADAIESVLSQTFKDIEIIVVDDGSNDDTSSILSSYINKKYIRYIYQENQGVSAARNAGIKIAQGHWVAFLDSDDRWMPDKLYRQLEIARLSRVKLGCIVCNMNFAPPVRGILNSFQNAPFLPAHPQGICFNMSSILLTRFILFNQGAMVRKEHLDEIGGFDQKLRILEDYDLALKLSFRCAWGYDTSPMVIYQRYGHGSLSSQVNSTYETKILLHIFKNLKLFLNHYSIPIPKLLNQQIKYYTIRSKCAHVPFMYYIFKLYKFLERRSSRFPRPQSAGLQLN